MYDSRNTSGPSQVRLLMESEEQEEDEPQEENDETCTFGIRKMGSDKCD